jgi:hypothetical protein
VLEDSSATRSEKSRVEKAHHTAASNHSKGGEVMLGILERIRTKKKELTQTTADAYFQLVREVAGGSEVDVEQAAIIIESNGKDDESFERDVETQQARIGLSTQLRHKQALEKRLPKLESAERQAGEHYARVVSEASEKLNEAKKARRDVELELLGLTQIEVRLRESCLDASLLQRETELNMQRTKLIQQRRPLEEDLSRSANTVQSHQSSVDALRKKIEKAKNDQLARQSYQRDLPQFETALEQHQHVVDQLEQAIAVLDAQLQPIDQALESIRLKKLEV